MGILMRRPSMDAIETEDVAARVYVGNLKPKVNETHLTEIFVRFGKLLHVWVARKPPGFAFVQFLNQSDAERAVEAFQGEDGLEILGKRVKVQMAGDKAQSKMAKEMPSRRDDRENDRRRKRSRSRSQSSNKSRGDRSRSGRRASDGRRRRGNRSRSRSRSPSRASSRRRRSRSTSIRSRSHSRSLSPHYRRKRSRSTERRKENRSRSRRS